MKRNFISRLTALALVSSAIVTAFPKSASAAWVDNHNGTWNYTESGMNVVGWRSIDGKFYYFDKNGQMQTGVIQIEGKIYIFGNDGALLVNSAVVDGKFYTINSKGQVTGKEFPTPKKGFNGVGGPAVVVMPDSIMEKDNTSGPDTTPKKDDTEEETSLYSVTFKDDDGTKLRTSMVKEGNKLTLYTPYKSGYKFVEWNTKEDGDGTSYDAGDKIRVSSKKTLYAVWEKAASTDEPGSEKVDIPVTSVEVSAPSKTITTEKGTLQFTAKVLPVDASKSKVTWSVEDTTGHATIDDKGLLTAVNNGEVVVKATATDGSGEYGRMLVKITGQPTSGTAADNPDTPSTPQTTDVFVSNASDAAALNGKTYKVIRVIATAANQAYTLENVTADHIVINGGSKITLKNCNIGNVEFYKSGINSGASEISPFVIKSEGSTVGKVSVYNEAATIIGSGIGAVDVTTNQLVNIGDGTTLTSIPEVNINKSSSKLVVKGNASVGKINVASAAQNSIITGDGVVSDINSKATVSVYLKNSADTIGGITNNKTGNGETEIDKQRASDAVDEAENKRTDEAITEAVNAIKKLYPAYSIGTYTGADNFIKGLDQRLVIVKNGNSIDSNTSNALQLINKIESKITEAKTTYRSPIITPLTKTGDDDLTFSGGTVNEASDVIAPQKPEINFAQLFTDAYAPIKQVKALNERTYLELIAKLNAEKDKYDLMYNVYKFTSSPIPEGSTKAEVVTKLTSIGLKSAIENTPQEKIPGFIKRLNKQISILNAKDAFKKEPVGDKQSDINYAVNTSLTATDAIETAKADVEAARTAVKTLYKSDETTLISSLDENKISNVKTYIDNALSAIETSRNLDKSLKLDEPYEADELLNKAGDATRFNVYLKKYDDAVLKYYTDTIKNDLFADYDAEILKSGVTTSKITECKTLVNNFAGSVYNITGESGSDFTAYENIKEEKPDQLTHDYIDKATDLLAKKQDAVKTFWNSVNVTGNGDAVSEFASKSYSSSTQTYSIKITVPGMSSFTYDNSAADPAKKGKLFIGSETPFDYNGAMTEAYLKLKLVNPTDNAEDIKIFTRSGSDAAWNEYKTYPASRAMTVNGDSSGKYTFAAADGKTYTVLFKIGYSNTSDGRVYVITMKPQ